MSTTPRTGGAPTRNRRSMLWTLAVLFLAVGGMSLTLGGGPTAALSPSVGHASLHPALLWTPLSITSFTSSSSPAFVGNATTISASVTGGQEWLNNSSVVVGTGYTYSYSGLPTGCSSANASALSCTPTTVGNFTVVLTVSDAGGNVTKNAIALRTEGFAIVTFSESPSTVSLGSPATFSATYAGVSGTVTWTWSGLPSGCSSVNAKAQSCTPTTPGTYSVTLNGTDTSGAYNTATALFRVTPVTITSFKDSPISIYTGQSTTFTVLTSGTTGYLIYSYTGLPTGSSGCLSQNTSSLSCVPRTVGTFSVTVTVKDSAGDTATSSATLTVKPLSITSFTASSNPAYEGIRMSFSVSASGYLGVVVAGVGTAGYPIYHYTGLPTGCLSANTSLLTCSASAIGTYTVVANVTDPTGNYTTSQIVLVVDPAYQPDFFVNLNKAVQTQPLTTESCQSNNAPPFYVATCYPQAQDPSLVSLPGGITGLGYALYTNATNNTCLGVAGQTNSRVLFGLSQTNGTTFYQTVNLGPTGCADLNAIEPSFAASASGNVYGVFIVENSTSQPNKYGVRPTDALGFVSSLSAGVSFSAVSMIDVSGNLAMPSIAVSGNTIYVVYEDIANSSTTLPGGVAPISVKFVSSTNGGASWSAVQTLPGMNKTEGWNAMSPSVAVSASGEVAVAYATDRSCVAWSGAPVKTTCLNYGSQVVAVTSSNNGTTWSAPSVASRAIPYQQAPVANVTGTFLGESTCYAGVCQPFFFESAPMTSVAFSGTTLVVGWSGAINNTLTVKTSQWWRWTAIGVSASANGGATWTGGVVAGPNWGSTTTVLGNNSNYYRPALGVVGTEVYVSYTEDNETNTTSGIGQKYPGPFDNSFSQWGTEAAIGSGASLTWGVPAPITLLSVPAGSKTNYTGNSFTGFHSSVSVNSYGQPLIGYVLPQLPTSTVVQRSGYYAANTSYGTSLTVSALAEAGMAQVVTLTIAVTGLNAGASWSLKLDYQLVTSNSTSFLVPNVPKGVTIYQQLLPAGGQNTWGSLVTAPVIAATGTYNAASTLTLTYSSFLYFNQTVLPFYQLNVSTPSCNPSNTYCEMEDITEDFTYECVNVPGRTCTTAPATTTYTAQCGYTSQVGCYYMEYIAEAIEEYNAGAGPYWYAYFYTVEYLYTYTPTQGYHEAFYLYNYCYAYTSGIPFNSTNAPWSKPCTSGSAASGSSACTNANSVQQFGESCFVDTTVGMWAPGGYLVTGGFGEGVLYNSYSASADTYWPNYFNGTGANAYNGPVQYKCLSSNQCPIPYGMYYYYGIYGYSTCAFAAAPSNYCAGSASIALTSPLNETDWVLPGGRGTTAGYPLDVVPVGLPSGTPYSFSAGGSTYSAVAPSAVLLNNAPAGAFTISGGTAAGSPSGWVYYAPSTTYLVPNVVFADLDFTAFVNTNVAPHSVTIGATNVTSGVTWGVVFNGTQYSSTTPSITVSTRPGYFGITSWGVNSSDGQTQYVPTNPVGSVNLTVATSYDLSFALSYRAVVTASSGGTIQVGSGKPGSSSSAFYKAGSTVTMVATPGVGYEFDGFTGAGLGSYTGNGTLSGSQYTATFTANGPVQEGAAFVLVPSARYNITFVSSSSLPVGTWWTVGLNGVEYSSDQASLTVTGLYPHSNPAGTYAMTVPIAYSSTSNGTRYIPGGFPNDVWTNGTATTVLITWTVQYAVTLAATSGGSVQATVGGVLLGAGTYWEPSGQTVAVTATPSTGYRFVGWNGTGYSVISNATPTISFDALGPTEAIAQFQLIPYVQPPEYVVSFTATTGMASGTSWTLTVSNSTETWQVSSLSRVLNVTGLNTGSYKVVISTANAPGGLTRYVPNAPPATVQVNGKNQTVSVAFTTQYWVSVKASSWGTVTVSEGGSSAAAATSGWYPAEATLLLQANATGTALFEGWMGNGTGAYSGGQASYSITVTGPVNEVAQFEPPAPATIQKGGALSSPVSWAVFAAVGLLAGLGIGMLMFMRRRKQPPARETAMAEGGAGMAEWSGPGDEGPMESADRESSPPNVSEYGSADRESSQPNVSEFGGSEDQ